MLELFKDYSTSHSKCFFSSLAKCIEISPHSIDDFSSVVDIEMETRH